jgi:exosortase
MAEGADRRAPPSVARALAWFSAHPRDAALWALNAALAVVAFGALVTFDPEPTLEREFEDVFFQPSDSSPSLVLLMAAWLAYRRWHRLLRVPARAGTVWPAGVLALLSGATLSWAVYTGARDLRTVALMLMVQSVACGFGGWRAMRVLMVPTLFLGFAIPMPAPLLNVLLTQMQLWTADFTGFLLYQLGLTAFVSGIEIHVDPNHFAVIETCSGVRITETLSMLTILMIDLFRRRGLHALILLALTPPVAFLFNGFRALSLILNPYSEIVQVHSLQGIAMLIGGILLLYFADGLLGKVLRPHRERRIGAAADAPSRPGPGFATAALGILATAALLIPPWGPIPRPALPSFRMPFMEMEGWEATDLALDRRFLGRIGRHWDLGRRFRRGREFVDLYFGVGNRSDRAASVLFSKALLQGGKWHTEQRIPILEPFSDAAAGSDGESIEPPRGPGRDALYGGEGPESLQVVVSLARRFLMVAWQEQADGLAAETARSFLGLDRSPFRRAGTPVVVRLSTPIAGRDPAQIERAELRLRDFYAQLKPTLEAFQERVGPQS